MSGRKDSPPKKRVRKKKRKAWNIPPSLYPFLAPEPPLFIEPPYLALCSHFYIAFLIQVYHVSSSCDWSQTATTRRCDRAPFIYARPPCHGATVWSAAARPIARSSEAAALRPGAHARSALLRAPPALPLALSRSRLSLALPFSRLSLFRSLVLSLFRFRSVLSFFYCCCLLFSVFLSFSFSFSLPFFSLFLYIPLSVYNLPLSFALFLVFFLIFFSFLFSYFSFLPFTVSDCPALFLLSRYLSDSPFPFSQNPFSLSLSYS